EFWSFLDQQYKDPMALEKACWELMNLEQKGTGINAFNAYFMRLVYKAGEEGNTNNLKTRYLGSLRNNLQDCMILVEVPNL
ncbi:hypothetical protein EJ02DRAFT_363240, partial [Clathrospora elynae]